LFLLYLLQASYNFIGVNIMDKYRIHDRCSKATKAMEDAWESLRKIYPQLPRVVIVILSDGDRGYKWGHFSLNSGWRYRQQKRTYEVGINPRLFRYHKDLLETLLHEAAHAILHKKHGGVSADGYYHNKLFRNACNELLLSCEFYNTRYGWTNTHWDNGQVPKLYMPILKKLKAELPMGVEGRKPPEIPGYELPLSGHIRLTCGCFRRSIYVSKSVAEKGGVFCSFCEKKFQMP
jgi:SprT-like family